jgi:peptidoglycan hydrolase CwlO-like protein
MQLCSGESRKHTKIAFSDEFGENDDEMKDIQNDNEKLCEQVDNLSKEITALKEKIREIQEEPSQS